ncbi:HesA/MoeB/ThiF family protein [Colwellia sp. MEBiC06753]
MLSAQEHIRYGRQILLSQIGEQGQLALQNAKVLIVGIGGLGCPVSLYLASAGVGKLILCDGDTVEASNLQRQILFSPNDIGQNKAQVAADYLTKQNPLIDIEVLDEALTGELAEHYYQDLDLVIDCTDSLSSRYLLNSSSFQYQVPLVIGAATGFDGQIFFINPKQQSACYECLMPQTPDNSNYSQDNCQTLGILGPVLAIVAGMQSLIAIKYLAKLSPPTDQLQLFDGVSQQWQQFKVSKQASCPACQSK